MRITSEEKIVQERTEHTRDSGTVGGTGERGRGSGMEGVKSEFVLIITIIAAHGHTVKISNENKKLS